MKNAPLSVNWTGSGAFYVYSLFLLWHLIFLSAAFTLLDDGIFHIVPEKTGQLFDALVSMLEKMLGVEDGQFLERTRKYWKFDP